MTIKHNNDGIPNIDITPIVKMFIGIIKPIGCTNKLYPYNKKELIIIFFIIFNINLIILST